MSHVHSGTCGCASLSLNASRRRDPTQTTGLRMRFVADVDRRFAALIKKVRAKILDPETLGAEPALVTNAAASERFVFKRAPTKAADFMKWLRKETSTGVLGVTYGTSVTKASGKAWTNVYIDSAYQKGLASAGSELRGAGVSVSDRWIDSAFYRPIHADLVATIYTRAYSDLEGITKEMDRQISSTLARGMAEGRGVMDIARDLEDRVTSIGRTRARTLARTEVIAAHADATLKAYDEAGAEGVQVRAEFTTAGDDAVCEECAGMEGRTYTMDEAEGIIPVHPNCRCAFLPVVSDPDGMRLD